MSSSSSSSALDPGAIATPSGYRVRPRVWIGFVVYAGYLAVFYTTWAVNDVDYDKIGDTVESAKLHYALPTLFGCAFLVVALTVLGWWRSSLFDKKGSGPRWVWIAVVAVALASGSAFLSLGPDNRTTSLVLWCVLGGIGVGFGEEMITRGSMLVGLRTRFPEEKVWLYSTLAFVALHIPNVFFGMPLSGVPVQLVNTFIFGSFMWAVRRVSRTLLLPIFLHGLWDTSIFLPRATGADANPFIFLAYPLMIAGAVVVVRRAKTTPAF